MERIKATKIKSDDKTLQEKIKRYIGSLGISRGERMQVEREIEKLKVKLGIEGIEPKEWVFLNKIRGEMRLGKKLDMRAMALASGYGAKESENPELTILRHINPALMSEILGYNSSDVEYELVKVMKQDEDLSAKIRAIELAGKLSGMMDTSAVKIQINSGIKLGE